MSNSDRTKMELSYIKRYALIIAVTWSVVVFALLLWNAIQTREETRKYAHIYTNSAFEKDILYRRWATMHGGVYVPVTGKTQPNPYLSDIPERDIKTPSGSQLTLMNPAYMTRQVYELEREVSGARSHLTSLKPIKPENAPDEWERKALIAFEQGEKELSSLENIEGSEYFRLMRPFNTEAGCLKCHAKQGYKVNDIRGGISVSLPMDSIKELAGTTQSRNISIYLLLWLVGTGGIVFGYYRVSKSEFKRNQAEKELEIAYLDLEKKVHDRTTDLNKVNEMLQESEECFRSIASNTPDHILIQDRQLRYTLVVNPQLGITEQEMLGKTDYDFLSSEEADRLTKAKRQVMETGEPLQIETSLINKEGNPEFFDGTYVPQFDAQGKANGLIGYFRNVTERKRAEEKIKASLREKDILISEIHHRVKNNLQVISGLLDLQARASKNPEVIKGFRESQDRIRAMALVHEKLYNVGDFSRIDLAGYVRSLSQELFQSHNIHTGKIDLTIQTDGEVYVEISKAIPCGLVMNELISNALKHAFPGDRPGKLQIIIRETENKEIEIIVRDNGLGLPEDVDIYEPRSVGLHLVNGLVKNQLDGQIEVKQDNGTEFRITFPL